MFEKAQETPLQEKIWCLPESELLPPGPAAELPPLSNQHTRAGLLNATALEEKGPLCSGKQILQGNFFPAAFPLGAQSNHFPVFRILMTSGSVRKGTTYQKITRSQRDNSRRLTSESRAHRSTEAKKWQLCY